MTVESVAVGFAWPYPSMTPVGFVPDEGLEKLVLFVVLKSHWARVVFWALAGEEKQNATKRNKRARAVEFYMAMVPVSGSWNLAEILSLFESSEDFTS